MEIQWWVKITTRYNTPCRSSPRLEGAYLLHEDGVRMRTCVCVCVLTVSKNDNYTTLERVNAVKNNREWSGRASLER